MRQFVEKAPSTTLPRVTQKSPFATTLEDVPTNTPAKPARVFSGIQPTGELHIGNYLGAVRTWRQQIEEGKDETIFCIVDTMLAAWWFSRREFRMKTPGD